MTRTLSENRRLAVGRLIGLLAVLPLLWLSACSDFGTGRPKIDSNSNWLTVCLSNADCEDGTSCICGVCTTVCETGDSCDTLDDAVCRDVDSVSVDLLCGDLGLPDTPVCLPECDSEDACDEGQTCVGGACVFDAEWRAELICEETGGSWDTRSCGHWECGEPPECDAIIPGCNCGPNMTFDPALGCRIDPVCMGLSDDEVLCEETGGEWEPLSCGHYRCGEAPLCEAIIPGCDCGTGRNFFEGEGCFEDATCSDPDEQALCEETDGTWDELSCGHYECGEFPPCDAIIPGCDCGEGRNFFEGEGCAGDDACHVSTEQALCVETDGTWDELSCGHYTCGVPPACEAIIPGCDCGAGRNFESEIGCVEDATCTAPSDEALCRETEGTWDEGSCGHYVCGEFPACDDVVPGCDCGAGRNFVNGEGCLEDPDCAAPGDRALCLETEGIWDELSCGHYICGVHPFCEAIIPGCDCGEGRNFVDGEGCVLDDACAHSTGQALCEDTGGTWHAADCGHWFCGLQRDCPPLEETPGCDCGDERNFVEEEGCVVDPVCIDLIERALCDVTEGVWHEESCGHWNCGVPLLECVVNDPGCDCGAERNFVAGEGCVVDLECPDPGAAALCEETGGTWDPTACGHYDCGFPQECAAVIPGCDCGPEHNFLEGEGCVLDESCVFMHQRALCLETDGIWDPESCGHYECGEFPPCDAIIPGCNCGAERNFFEGEGCAVAEICL